MKYAAEIHARHNTVLTKALTLKKGKLFVSFP